MSSISPDCGLQRKDSRWFCLCVNVYKWCNPDGVSKREISFHSPQRAALITSLVLKCIKLLNTLNF